jgi:hypothetical protein
MNTSKLNDWLQMAAAAGVIVGLILVAYEIRISNRTAIEQANAESASQFNAAVALYSTAEAADLFTRAYEGDVLSRQEMFRLDQMMNAVLSSIYYDWSLSQSGTIFADKKFLELYGPSIQWHLGSEIGRRKWEIDGQDWGAPFAAIVNSALAASTQKDVLAELDYMRGATESIE